MRPRLALLTGLLKDVTGSGRGRERPRPTRRAVATSEEERSAQELKRRLDATRQRMRQEIPPREE